MEKINTSRQLFYELVEQLKANIAGLSVSETDKWCGLYQQTICLHFIGEAHAESVHMVPWKCRIHKKQICWQD